MSDREPNFFLLRNHLQTFFRLAFPVIKKGGNSTKMQTCKEKKPVGAPPSGRVVNCHMSE